MNQGCVKHGVRLGVRNTLRNVLGRCATISLICVAALPGTMGLFHNPLPLQSYSSDVIMYVTH
jgi:hypothetical protein